MADKEVLIEITVDNAAAQKSITEQTRKIELLKEGNDKLKKTNKELAKQGSVTAAQRAKNSEQIAKNSFKIAEANKVRRKSITTLNTEKNSLGQVKAALAQANIARDKVNLSTKKGQQAYKDLTVDINKYNTTLNQAEQQGNSFKRNVGNYTNGIRDAGDSIGKMSPALGGMIQGIVGATRAALAFIATPIGLVLAAIAVALAAVTQYFKRTEDGGNKLAVGMAYLGSILESVLDIVVILGKLLFDVFVNQFNFIANNVKIAGASITQTVLAINVAWQKVFGSAEDYAKAQEELAENSKKINDLAKEQVRLVKDTINVVGEAIDKTKEEIALTKEKAELSAKLQDDENKLVKTKREQTIANAELNRQIFEGLKIAKDETKSFEERKKALDSASEAEQKRADNLVEVAKAEAEIAVARTKQHNSTADDFDAEAEAIAKVTEAETASLRVQTKIQATKLTLLKQEEAANNAKRKQDEKDAADEQKLLDDKLARETKNADDLKALELQKEIDKGGTPQEKAEAEITALDYKHEQEINKIKERLATENELTLEQLNERLSNGALTFASLEEANYNHAQAVIKINEDASNEVKANDDKLQKDIIANDKKTTQIRKQNAQGYLSALGSIFNTAGQLAGDNFKLQKAFGIAEAVVNTARGVTQALGSAPPPLSFVTAGAVAVAGAAQIATIAKSQPSGDTSVPVPSQGGLTEPTADTSGADNAANQQEALQNAIASLNLNIAVSEINDAQASVSVSEENSTIGG